ncbi:MAG: BrnA antitoxin family protein [Bryobacteraceae bacterium]
MNANGGNMMKRYRLNPKKPRKLTPAEARRLDAKPIDYSDIPPLGDEFFTKAMAAWPPAKTQLTIRLDADVLGWLKANGKGYQTRINHILRAAMESQLPRRSRSTATPKPKTRKRAQSKFARA